MSDRGPPEMQIAPARRSFLRNLSPIWLVPLLALTLVGYIGWRSWSERGTLIEISFQNASGIVPGQTTVRLRDVVIGTVERVTFTRDLSRVVVRARIETAVAETLPEDASFWVVSPEVSTRGISGLDTVLSGVYIAAAWEPVEGVEAFQFTGLEQPPAVPPGRAGSRITIRARDGNMLTAGAPVIFHGIEVGRLERPVLGADGSVTVSAFIDAPNDARLTTATRFWDMSGFSVSFGAAGLTLNVASLAALVSGGVAFDNVFSGGQPLPAGHVFDLFPDETSARDSVFSMVGANAVSFRIEFEGTVNGLVAGAPVMYRGLRVGEVESIGAYVATEGGRRVVQLQTVVTIDPQAMGLPLHAGRPELLALLSEAVAKDGLRARLATTSLFSSALQVQLVEDPQAPPAELAQPVDGLPVIPSTASSITDVTATAEGVLRRFSDLPIEEVFDQAISTMQAIETFAASPDTQAVPGNLNGLLEEARAIVGSDRARALPENLAEALDEVRAAVADLRERGTADRLAQALTAATLAAESVSTAVEDMPLLIADLRAVARKANDLELERLVASATLALDGVETLVSSPGAQDLPPAMTSALKELAAVIAEMRETSTVDKLVAALEAAYDAALTVDAAGSGVPLLVEDLRQVAQKAGQLDLETLVSDASRVLQSADALIGTDAARALPESLSAALDELRSSLAEIREGGLIDNANGALQSARDAADSVAAAADGLPALADRLQGIAGEAEALIATYGARSDANRELLSALRELREAGRAISSLARSIERNPNSLLIGR